VGAARTYLLLAAGATVVLALPAAAPAAEAETTAIAPPPSVSTTAEPAPEAPGTPPVSEAPAATTPEEAPQVQEQQSQSSSAGTKPAPAAPPKAQAPVEAAGGTVAQPRASHKALAPSALTPSLPLALRGSIAGVPSFFIENFEIPPFLLPIFQAAGAAYGIPWQVLAAINEVETDYGRDLSTSSAGAEGWMQFLPESWAQYGVDANGDGYKDPYNPADAIFAAARYLRAAGGEQNIRDAVFSYNHSQAYVSSVMLRAQLLGGTPSELLGAITGLTEARFPVYAAAHFADGFPAVRTRNGTSRTLVGTAIYAPAGSPVIASQDGEVEQVGDSPTLGHYVRLRDAYGNQYTYARLGSLQRVYPVIEPRVDSKVSAGVQAAPSEPAPSGPATAGEQPRSPMTEGAAVSGLALGAAAGLEAARAPSPAPAPAPVQPVTPQTVAPHVQAFREGSSEVYLHDLRPGVQVIAGTVLGRVGPASGSEDSHIVFQIRPAGPGASLIDPKPVLDGWVALENSSVFHAKGENPFLATSPTVGQVLLESKQQLEPQVLRDAGIHLTRCAREDVSSGRVDKRVLAALEYLSVSSLKPTVAGMPCPPSTAAALAANTNAGSAIEAISITAVGGIPVAGHQGAGTAADTAVRRLLMLQGLSRPQRIVSEMRYPATSVAVTSAHAADAIRVVFAAPRSTLARVAGLYASALSPQQWDRLIARLGQIPDPAVSSKPSSAAIPVTSGKGNGGNH
jgi:murein DD-endopeptidase MepM/ murein hydrolase activator NlpD